MREDSALKSTKGSPAPRGWRSRRARYHHGDLRGATLRLGRRVIARSGTNALTLRGLARELGVNASALVYHFGRRDQLLVEIAYEVDDELREVVSRAPGIEELGHRWADWGRANANLYRHLAINVPTLNSAVACQPSAHRRLLRRLDALMNLDARRRRQEPPPPSLAGAIYIGLHGVAALAAEAPRDGAVHCLLEELTRRRSVHTP